MRLVSNQDINEGHLSDFGDLKSEEADNLIE